MPPKKSEDKSAVQTLESLIAANPALAHVLAMHPCHFHVAVLQGWNPASLNAVARHWVTSHESGRLTPVEGLAGCKTCEGYTVVDLGAASTPGDRSAAMEYVREISKLRHATRGTHLVLVYDMHLVSSRCFMDLQHVRLVGTTCRSHALSDGLRSQAVMIRVRTDFSVPPKLSSLARVATAGGLCVPGARKYSHEALKACLDPAMSYRALIESSGWDQVDAAADLEWTSLQVTRPVHALELLALRVQAL